ncbi:MAG: HIT domain-containing protein [Beijerinckiaceae bacterium]|nr:HIT domain-containing protein [Beijerinckiaceae bacterium]
MPAFTLDSRLQADTLPIGELTLCRVLLMDDARFPWLILVPRKADLADLIDLDVDERRRLMDEIAMACDALKAAFGPDKLNVAALGNQVRQLHVHVIARFTSDVAWPSPVWGVGERQAYPPHASGSLVDRLGKLLAPHGLTETQA